LKKDYKGVNRTDITTEVALSELLDIKPVEVRRFMHVSLSPVQAKELYGNYCRMGFRSDFLFAHNMGSERCLQAV
jgi:hypothetical protein